jgi:hypothetical protein
MKNEGIELVEVWEDFLMKMKLQCDVNSWHKEKG